MLASRVHWPCAGCLKGLEPKGFRLVPIFFDCKCVCLCVSCSEAIQMFVFLCMYPLTRFLRKYAKLSLQAEHVQ